MTMGIASADSLDVELVSITGGSVWDVSVSGNYMYLVQGQDLAIFDISNISHPINVGTIDIGSDINSIASRSNDLVYISTSKAILAINVANPALPVIEHTYTPGVTIKDIVVSGNTVYVAHLDGLVIEDISDPSSPTTIGELDLSSLGRVEGIDVSSNYVYITNSEGLLVIDISNPSSPMLVGGYGIPEYNNDVFISGNYAYMLSDVERNLEIVDISNSSSPTYKGYYGYGTVDYEPYTDDIFVEGDLAYLAFSEGIDILDVSDPSSPVLIGHFAMSSQNKRITVADNYVFVGDGNALSILSVDTGSVNSQTTTISYSPTYDNRLRESSPSSVLSTTTYVDVGKSTSRSRDVMMFDLNDYKSTDTISKAILSLYWYYPAAATRTSDTVVEIYRPVEWDPKYVSWKNSASGKSWTNAGGSWYDKNSVAQGTTPYASVTFSAGTVPDNKYYEFDISQLVQEYVSGKFKNTGFFIKAKTESGNYIAFYSNDWSNAAQKPKLTITSTSGSVVPATPVTYTPVSDNRLRESSPSTVLSTTPYLDVGMSTSRCRDLLLFNLSGYKTTDKITKATLSLYWYYPVGSTRAYDTVVEIYRPYEWDPKYVSWKNSASGIAWTNTGGSWYDKNAVSQGTTPYASVTFSASSVPDNKYYDFDVTSLVQEYISGKYTNTGFFLKAKTESGNYIAFYSSDWSNADQKPKLTITQ